MSSSDDDVPLANGTRSNGASTNGEHLFSLLFQFPMVDWALESLVAQAASDYTLFDYHIDLAS